MRDLMEFMEKKAIHYGEQYAFYQGTPSKGVTHYIHMRAWQKGLYLLRTEDDPLKAIEFELFSTGVDFHTNPPPPFDLCCSTWIEVLQGMKYYVTCNKLPKEWTHEA